MEKNISVKELSGRIVIGPFEKVEILSQDGVWEKVDALVDSGARVSSIDENIATDLGLYEEKKILYKGSYSSALGKQKRPVIEVTYRLAGEIITTRANVADRSKRRRRFLVGRRDLAGFLVKVERGDDVK